MSFRSILELDARLSSQLRVAEKPGFLRNVAAFLAHSGDSWFWFAALFIFWFFSNSFWKHWEVVEFFGILGLAGVVLGIKFLVRRKRPEGEPRPEREEVTRPAPGGAAVARGRSGRAGTRLLIRYHRFTPQLEDPDDVSGRLSVLQHRV